MSQDSINIQRVEIIRVRLSRIEETEKVKLIFKSLQVRAASEHDVPFKAGLYHNPQLPSDWAIHLIWLIKCFHFGTSPLGAKLINALKEYGLVNHSTWEKEA